MGYLGTFLKNVYSLLELPDGFVNRRQTQTILMDKI